MSRIKQNEALRKAEVMTARLKSAGDHMANFVQAVSEVRTARQNYEAAEDDANERAATLIDVRAAVAATVNERKVGLAHALDTMAAFLVDGEGEPLTRQALLNTIAAVPAAE